MAMNNQMADMPTLSICNGTITNKKPWNGKVCYFRVLYE
jgi:hypothetical protein